MGDSNVKFSQDRLGIAGMVPSVPVMPTAAQVSVMSGMMHLKLGSDAYVRASLPAIPPASYKAVVAAIRSCPTNPSWSGTGTPYFVLTVEPDPTGTSCVLKAGDTVVGRVAVFADAEIVSVDVPLSQQYQEGSEHGHD
jgi:hypothetical protein